MNLVNFANFTNLYLKEPLASSKVNLWFEELMENIDELEDIDVDEKANKYTISNSENIKKSISISCEIDSNRIAICIGGEYDNNKRIHYLNKIFNKFSEKTEIFPINIRIIELNQVWGFMYKGNQISLIEDTFFKKSFACDIFSGGKRVPIRNNISMLGWIDDKRKVYIDVESATDYSEIENDNYEEKPFIISVKAGLPDPIEEKIFNIMDMISEHELVCLEFFETRVKKYIFSFFDEEGS